MQLLHDMSSPGATTPRLLTTAAAARVASCDRVTVWRAIERGELAAVRLGSRGAYRIRPEALARWLQPKGPNPEGETQ